MKRYFTLARVPEVGLHNQKQFYIGHRTPLFFFFFKHLLGISHLEGSHTNLFFVRATFTRVNVFVVCLSFLSSRTINGLCVIICLKIGRRNTEGEKEKNQENDWKGKNKRSNWGKKRKEKIMEKNKKNMKKWLKEKRRNNH